MSKIRLAMALALAFPPPLAVVIPAAGAQIAPSVPPALSVPPAAAPATATVPAADGDAPTHELGVVTVTGGQPTSLPTQIPATMEGIDGRRIEASINATDSEDALKYFPSLLVRKRYVGDYNHAILSSRASGTGNSARSAVYADGILLSNYLGNGVGGLSFPPRWGLVTPEEIERVDVMYGPFSAAYPGNSVGAVVDYVTRMPTRFEAHGKIGTVIQPFSLYGTDATFRATQASASAGSRAGDWSWFVNFNHTDSHGQPLTFATRLAASGTPGGAGTPVTGAVPGRSSTDQPWYLIGSATEYRTRQDHVKVKLGYDFSPTLRAAYTFGVWQNDAEGRSTSYLRDAAGVPVTRGAITIDGRGYAPLTGADFPLIDESLLHTMHGLSLKSRTRGVFDWEIAASRYGYDRDRKRQNAAGNPLPDAAAGGAGTIADGAGTGWTTVVVRGTWRPGGAHVIDLGAQQDRYRLGYRTSAIAGDWRNDPGGATVSNVTGTTAIQVLYAQDTWSFAPRWKAVLGARAEWWSAEDGSTTIATAAPPVATRWPARDAAFVSPKAALSWQWRPDTVLKASLGRAVRFPTVAELYGATATANAQFVNDPNLAPERSWTGELTAERSLGAEGLVRLTAFAERTRDALYTQTQFDSVANRNVSRVENVGRIATRGLEIAAQDRDVGRPGLDASGSITWTDSTIRANDGFAALPGDTLGKRQPNIARWRATALLAYRWDERWTTSVGARYSGRQYRTLDNSDVNGFAYMGVSRFFVVDLRVRLRLDRRTVLAAGIDNVGNDRYWNFHPYPQRSYFAELKVDL
ncbi:MAG: TonB-dependent receptor [Lautropia sp.]